MTSVEATRPTGTHLRRPTWIDVDLDRLAANVQAIRSVVGPERQLVAVVKANGIGHGLGVAATLAESGADVLASGDLNEAVALREAGYEGPLMLFGSCVAEDVADVVAAYGISPTVWDLESAEAYSRASGGDLELYLKIDSGAHRLGVLPQDAARLAAGIAALPGVTLAHVYTSLPNPAAHAEAAARGYAAFVGALKAIRCAGVDVPRASAAASAVLGTDPNMYLNAVRTAHILFGYSARYGDPSPVDEGPVPFDVAPAATALRSRVIQVQEVPAGEAIGYWQIFRAPRPTRYALLPIGWRDGLTFENTATDVQVLVRGRRCPFIPGTMAAEHLAVDVTDVPGVRPGDDACLWGRDGDEEITVAEHAAWSQSSPIQVVINVGATTPHRYLRESTEDGR